MALTWLSLLIAAAGGVAITLQAQFMGIMDQTLGTRESMAITYGSGGLLMILAILAVRGGNLAAWKTVPWYVSTAGLLGLVIIGSIGYTVPRLGIVTVLSVLVVAQFTAAALIDHYGWFGAIVRPVDWTRLLGMGIMLLGAWLVIRK